MIWEQAVIVKAKVVYDQAYDMFVNIHMSSVTISYATIKTKLQTFEGVETVVIFIIEIFELKSYKDVNEI